MGVIELWKGEGMKLEENLWKAGSWWQSVEQRRRSIIPRPPHAHWVCTQSAAELVREGTVLGQWRSPAGSGQGSHPRWPWPQQVP